MTPEDHLKRHRELSGLAPRTDSSNDLSIHETLNPKKDTGAESRVSGDFLETPVTPYPKVQK